MSLQPFDRFWWNLARWRTLVPYSGPRPGKYTTRVDPHVDNSHQVWSWYYHPLPSYSISVCSYVTWRWPLTFDLLTLNSWRTWRVTWLTLPRSLNTLCLSVLDLWVITFPFGYHWECVRGHCVCAESRDPWVGGQKQLHFCNPRPRFAYSLYNFYLVTTTIKGRLHSSVTNAKALDCVNFLCVTLWPWPLTFWSLTFTTHGGSRDQPYHQVWRPSEYSFMNYEL